MNVFEERIEKALEIIDRYSGIDGAHYRAWVLDQVVRRLTGCQMEKRVAEDAHGNVYTYDALGGSDEYRAWVARHKAGEDGPETYEWDEGIAP